MFSHHSSSTETGSEAAVAVIGVLLPSSDAVETVPVAAEVTTTDAALAGPSSTEDEAEDEADTFVSFALLRATAIASKSLLPPAMADSGVDDGILSATGVQGSDVCRTATAAPHRSSRAA